MYLVHSILKQSNQFSDRSHMERQRWPTSEFRFTNHSLSFRKCSVQNESWLACNKWTQNNTNSNHKNGFVLAVRWMTEEIKNNKFICSVDSIKVNATRMDSEFFPWRRDYCILINVWNDARASDAMCRWFACVSAAWLISAGTSRGWCHFGIGTWP